MIAAVQRMPAELAFVVFTRTAFLAALVVVLAVASPHFLTTDNMVIVLRQAALQFLMSAGLTLVVLTGGIDLSVGAVLGLAACLGAASSPKAWFSRGFFVRSAPVWPAAWSTARSSPTSASRRSSPPTGCCGSRTAWATSS